MPLILPWHLIEHKLIACLVDTVVGQVDEVVPNLCRIIAILGCGKPYQAFFINKDLDRVNTGQEDVETQVKLQTIDKERIVNIFLVKTL